VPDYLAWERIRGHERRWMLRLHDGVCESDNRLVEMKITRKKGSMWKNCGPYEIRCFDRDLWSGKYLSF
jgi:hypothetical protein